MHRACNPRLAQDANAARALAAMGTFCTEACRAVRPAWSSTLLSRMLELLQKGQRCAGALLTSCMLLLLLYDDLKRFEFDAGCERLRAQGVGLFTLWWAGSTMSGKAGGWKKTRQRRFGHTAGTVIR
jgi:hypothetical protein